MYFQPFFVTKHIGGGDDNAVCTVVVGRKSGDACLVELSRLPKNARIVATGTTLEEIMKDGDLYSEV